MKNDIRPILRPLDFQPVLYQGQPMWFLRDPLQLSDKQLFMPEAMGPLLAFMDGKRTPAQIHDAFCQMVGERLDPELTLEAINRLDEAYLLENENSKQAKRDLLVDYRSRPYRPPALAGNGYPAEPLALTKHLLSYAGDNVDSGWHGRGIVSPHIDYNRGGPVYSQVWRSAERAILDAY